MHLSDWWGGAREAKQRPFTHPFFFLFLSSFQLFLSFNFLPSFTPSPPIILHFITHQAHLSGILALFCSITFPFSLHRSLSHLLKAVTCQLGYRCLLLSNLRPAFFFFVFIFHNLSIPSHPLPLHTTPHHTTHTTHLYLTRPFL